MDSLNTYREQEICAWVPELILKEQYLLGITKKGKPVRKREKRGHNRHLALLTFFWQEINATYTLGCYFLTFL